MAEGFAAACRLNGDSTEYFKLLVAFDHADNDVRRNELHEQLSRFARSCWLEGPSTPARRDDLLRLRRIL